jgi:hypothetical protein
MRRALALLPLLLACAAARADLSPMLYLCWARQAPEALELRVERLRKMQHPQEPDYLLEVATLRVRAVRRSGSGLRAGDRIQIETVLLKNPPPPVRGPGPARAARLRVGQDLTAFLQRDGGGKAYAPAARGQSFDRGLWQAEADPSKLAETSC